MHLWLEKYEAGQDFELNLFCRNKGQHDFSLFLARKILSFFHSCKVWTKISVSLEDQGCASRDFTM